MAVKTPTFVLAVIAFAIASPALAAPVTVEVAEARGVFTVTGRFTVPATPAGTWRVLTDYDRFARFIPRMRSATLERSGARQALVEQETTTQFLAFQKTNRVVLRIDEEPYRRIRFSDVELKDFARYSGEWSLLPAGTETHVHYRAEATPRFMPPAIGPAIMTETVKELLSHLRDEVLRRQASGQ